MKKRDDIDGQYQEDNKKMNMDTDSLCMEVQDDYTRISEPNIPELIRLPFTPKASEWQAMLDGLEHSVNWAEDVYEAFGRQFRVPRLQAWFADPGIRYRYSDNLVPSAPWPDWLQGIRRAVESAAGMDFNSVLLTRYRDGFDSVSWHADDEAELGRQPWIVSLSLGAERDFCYRRKDRVSPAFALPLKEGDLLLMSPDFQHEWLHQIPEQPEVSGVRTNLTFRWVVPPKKPGARRRGRTSSK